MAKGDTSKASSSMSSSSSLQKNTTGNFGVKTSPKKFQKSKSSSPAKLKDKTSIHVCPVKHLSMEGDIFFFALMNLFCIKQFLNGLTNVHGLTKKKFQKYHIVFFY